MIDIDRPDPPIHHTKEGWSSLSRGALMTIFFDIVSMLLAYNGPGPWVVVASTVLVAPGVVYLALAEEEDRFWATMTVTLLNVFAMILVGSGAVVIWVLQNETWGF